MPVVYKIKAKYQIRLDFFIYIVFIKQLQLQLSDSNLTNTFKKDYHMSKLPVKTGTH